jgi:transcriptional regulator with XRE-family HTH domain
MNELVKELKEDLKNEEGRHAYADAVTNAFIAAQIKALREARGLTQTDLAERMGTKQSGVSRLQRMDYSSWKVETLRKLARAFGVRLRMRFEEFGTLPDEINGFDEKNLAPRKFQDDPAFKEPTPTIYLGLAETGLAEATMERKPPANAHIDSDGGEQLSLMNRQKKNSDNFWGNRLPDPAKPQILGPIGCAGGSR